MTIVVVLVIMGGMFSLLGLYDLLAASVRPTRYRIACPVRRGEAALRRRYVDRGAATALRALCGAW